VLIWAKKRFNYAKKKFADQIEKILKKKPETT
jgi:hypothetical protein